MLPIFLLALLEAFQFSILCLNKKDEMRVLPICWEEIDHGLPTRPWASSQSPAGELGQWICCESHKAGSPPRDQSRNILQGFLVGFLPFSKKRRNAAYFSLRAFCNRVDLIINVY